MFPRVAKGQLKEALLSINFKCIEIHLILQNPIFIMPLEVILCLVEVGLNRRGRRGAGETAFDGVCCHVEPVYELIGCAKCDM